MTVPALRLGLVGCGRLAERGYLPALAALDDVRLVAVADPVPSRQAAVEQQARALLGTAPATAGSAAALVAAHDVDAVLVASPVDRHVDDAAAIAAAGVVALVEKPPAPTAAAAAGLADLDPAPYLGFNRRFDPGARRVRAAVPGEGDVDLRLRLTYRRGAWRAHTVADDALADLGPHVVDWARWLTGQEVLEASCTALGQERAAVVLRLERGRAALEVATDRPYEERIELRGADGRPVLHRRGGYLAGAVGRLLPGRAPDALVLTLREELAALAAALRAPDAPTDLARPADGLAVMSVIDAARRSAAAGGAPATTTTDRTA